MKYVVFLTLVVLLSIPFSFSNGIWTYAEDIRAGVFGDRENTDPGVNYNFTFEDIVYFNANIFGSENMVLEGDISATRFVDRVDSSFFIELSSNSVINSLNAQRINASSNLLYRGEELDVRFIRRDGDNTVTGDLVFEGGTINLQGGNIENSNTINSNTLNANTVNTNQVCDSSGANCVDIDTLGPGIGSDPNQRWRGVSRQQNVGYQNDLPYPIMVSVIVPRGLTGCTVAISSDRSSWTGLGCGSRHSPITFQFIVPPGHWYGVSFGSTSCLNEGASGCWIRDWPSIWREFR